MLMCDWWLVGLGLGSGGRGLAGCLWMGNQVGDDVGVVGGIHHVIRDRFR